MEKNITSSTLASESVLNPMEPAVQSSAARGKIRVVKKSYFDPPVTGAGYGVYTDKACTKAVDALWIGTIEKDYDEATNLPFGTYYVKEFSAPKGYKLDEVVHEVTISQNHPLEIVLSLEPTTEAHGNIKVVKKSKFSIPVTGAGYGVYKDKACTQALDALWIGLADANSDISCDLKAGTYYVKEFAAPDKYALDKTVHTVSVKNGQTAIVTSDEPLSASTVILLRPDGTYYTRLKVNDEFPSVACEEYNVLGCSKTKHTVFTPESIKSSGKDIVDTVDNYFMESDKITSGGVYYMVAFKENTNSYQVSVKVPNDNTVVYFVGDSRMVHLYDTLVNSKALSLNSNGNRKLDGKVEFVAEMGVGIDWFQSTGFSKLESKLELHKGKNNIIIFNWGVNDAASKVNPGKYPSVFQNIATKLKSIDSGCKLYFADVYPVSHATLYAHDNDAKVTVAQIKKMNEVIDKVCQNGYYTKIDLYDHLKQNGWFYDLNKATAGPNEGKPMYDGIHPSPTTGASVYQFCIEKTECGNGNVTLQLPSN